MPSSKFDTVVVGSGLGGLIAAAHLAAVGRDVLLLERYSALGGSSHVFRRQGRWEFDCGVHYIGDGGPDGLLTGIFRGLGMSDRVTWLPLDPAGFDVIRAPGLQLPIPVGWDAYRDNLVAVFPEDAPGRPGVSTAIRGLHLVGTSTTFGPGTLGAMLSGRHAAGAVVGRDLSAEVRAGSVLADPSRFAPWDDDFDALAATSHQLDRPVATR